MNDQNSLEYDTNLNKPLEIAVQYDDVLSNPIPADSAKLGELLDAKISKSNKIIGLRTDWDNFEVGRFSYQADNIMNVTGIRVEDYFQLGDKVFITQSTDKYFYIIEVDTVNNRITLNAGDDFTYIDAPITYFGTSRLSSPSGHPQIFDFSTSFKIYTYNGSTWTDNSARFVPGDGTREAGYSMNGSIVTVTYFAGSNIFPSGVLTVVFTSPFSQRTESQVNIGLITALSTGAIDTASDIHIDMSWGWINALPSIPAGAGELGVVIGPARLLGSTFDANAWACKGTFTPSI